MAGKKRVVILENEGIIALYIKTILHKENYEAVSLFRDFNSLTAYLENEHPDLIIIDTIGNSSVEKVRVLIETYDIPVLFFTETPDEEKKGASIRKCRLLRKPFEGKELQRILRQGS